MSDELGEWLLVQGVSPFGEEVQEVELSAQRANLLHLLKRNGCIEIKSCQVILNSHHHVVANSFSLVLQNVSQSLSFPSQGFKIYLPRTAAIRRRQEALMSEQFLPYKVNVFGGFSVEKSAMVVDQICQGRCHLWVVL